LSLQISRTFNGAVGLNFLLSPIQFSVRKNNWCKNNGKTAESWKLVRQSDDQF